MEKNELKDLMKRTQEIVNRTPLANFGNVKVRKADNETDALILRAFSPADAVRLISALRAEGISVHSFTYDANKVGILNN